ncbi:MAG: acid phosphatase type 7 [Pseudonocardiales bacterium]|nr:acid phosphatase type 7 [Pseudonocardiales bacterium]
MRLCVAALLGVSMLVGFVARSTPAAASTSVLSRLPYLTDLTSTSVAVTWATTSADTSPGVVTYGPAGSCTQSAVAAQQGATSYTAFGETAPYYQHTVQLGGLTPGGSYCYRIYSGASTPGTPLLDEPPKVATSFTTSPAPGAASPFSFDVLGDFGETSLSNNPPLGTYNQYQAALDGQLAASASAASNPALFAVSTGDVAYNSGTTTNYGDVNHPADGPGGAAEQSNIFDPRYWGKVGSSLPTYTTTGNHGRNSTFISTWPTPNNVKNSNGVYTSALSYPAVDGIAAGKYPSDWYAFTVGGVRFYVLDADWTDVSPTSYPSLGTACPSACPSYQVERDEHWQQASAEYQWLASDLQNDIASRGGSALRMAFFHYPLRVDQNNYTTQQDVYLQNSAANPTGGGSSLEALLNRGNVNLVFNGHAHLYERNVAPLGGVPNYVTGGGGAVPTNVSSICSPTDAYARGWDPTHAVGSSCGAQSNGAAAKPSVAAQAYHFLKVRVSGNDVTVNPTDSTGAVFDPMTYHFAADSTPPSTPGAPTAVRGTGTSSSNVTVTLGTASSDNIGVVSYDVYRDGAYRATMPAGVTKWVDLAVPAGTHAWTTVARDQRGNPSPASAASSIITISDTSDPSVPGTPVAKASTGTPNTVQLSWTPSTDNVGVVGYNVYRDGTLLIAGVGGPATADTTAKDVTNYSYAVQAVDAAGNRSGLSAGGSITTPDWTAPTAPALSASSGPPNEIDLSWSGSTDNVSVSGYDVYRDGGATAVATNLTGSTWADTRLMAGTTHSYVVVARDAAGNSSPASNAASATVDSAVVPVGSPTALTASQRATPGQIAITWSAPTTGTASSYALYRGTQLLWSGTPTSYTDTAAPDSTDSTYTVVAFDSAGNSASASVTVTPDWTPPTAPSGVRAVATSTSSATINWTASTDAVGVTSYRVTRTDSAGTKTTIATVAPDSPPTATDAAGVPGASYSYSVTAQDAAGNTSAAGTASVLLPVFTEDLESGTFTAPKWTTPTVGLVTEQSRVHAGNWAAKETSTGSPTWSSAQLPTTYRALHVSAWIYVASRSTSAGFLKVRTATGAFIAYLYVNASGYLSIRNDAGNVTHVSTTPVSSAGWHKVDMWADTNPGGPITLAAALDGTPVSFTTPVSSTETLGTSAIGQIVLGDTVSARTYDIAIDDVTADTATSP